MPLLSPFTPTLNYGTPINWAAPLNRGLTKWLVALPQRMSAPRLIDLCGKTDATFSSSPAWNGIRRPGGWGAVKCTGGASLTLSMSQIMGTDAFTFSFWHRPQTWTGGFTALLDDTGREWSMFVNTSGNISFVGSITTGLAGGAMTVEKWWHVVLTRPSGSGQVVSFYVNGVLIDTGSVDRDATAATLQLGSNPSGGGTSYDGNYDDIRFYQARNLSTSEVDQLYRAGLSGYQQELNRIRLPVVAKAAENSSSSSNSSSESAEQSSASSASSASSSSHSSESSVSSSSSSSSTSLSSQSGSGSSSSILGAGMFPASTTFSQRGPGGLSFSQRGPGGVAISPKKTN